MFMFNYIIMLKPMIANGNVDYLPRYLIEDLMISDEDYGMSICHVATEKTGIRIIRFS